MGDGRVDYLVEVVWQDFRGEADGYALDSLEEQQGELDREGHRLLLAAVVRWHPVGDLGVVERVEGEGGEARLDVTSGCRVVAGEDVAPVSLGVDQQLFLAQLHERVLD